MKESILPQKPPRGRVAFGMCGSFCTLSKAVIQIEKLKELGAEVFPIMSPITYSVDTRFGTAKSFIEKIEGDYYNVVGLDVGLLAQMLKEF